METIIFDGKPLTANEFRAKCLIAFPGLQSSRKYTIWENIQRMAEGGNERAKEFTARVKTAD